jgi:hypothetical protein
MEPVPKLTLVGACDAEIPLGCAPVFTFVVVDVVVCRLDEALVGPPQAATPNKKRRQLATTPARRG